MLRRIRRFAVCLGACALIASPALAQSIKFDGADTDASGKARTGPVNVSSTNPLPVTDNTVVSAVSAAAVTPPVAINAVPTDGSKTWSVGIVCDYNSTYSSSTTGLYYGVRCDQWRNFRVAIAAPVLSGISGVANTVACIAQYNNDTACRLLGVAMAAYNGTTWDAVQAPANSFKITSSAATTNANSVKTSATKIFAINACNTTATIKYIKVYNQNTSPNVGTDSPVLTYGVQANSCQRVADFGITGFYLSSGLSIALTGGPANSDATALAAGDITALELPYN